ncbi:MAG: GntR family transcriptional regulator [Sphingomonadales bacterium]|nr:GntR family transcriptional regulator [Sphingomonadales bacterium]
MPKADADGLRLKLSQQIIELCRREGWTEGQRLTERQLAQHFGVSRSPIRSALEYLVNNGAIARTEAGGYVLAVKDVDLADVATDVPPPAEDELYLRILRERFTGALPEHVSEANMMRRYDVTRSQLLKVLMRLSEEGFLVRGPGNGWQFKEFLQTVAAYQASYEYRLAVEPAAIRSPNYLPDVKKLRRLRKAQEEIARPGGLGEISGISQFDLDAELHETIAGFSQNPFFVDAVRHHNRLRRVVEYESFEANERMEDSCAEHIQILDALLADDREWAATLLTRHLILASESIDVFLAEAPSRPAVRAATH